MRLTVIADLRNPNAVQWIRAFVERGDDVQALSSHPVDDHVLPGAAVSVFPLVFASLSKTIRAGPSDQSRPNGSMVRQTIRRMASPQRVASIRSVVGPTAVRCRRRALQGLIDQHQPDLIYARRIPFEGIAAAQITGPPLIVSTTGNDFTLFAPRTRAMTTATRQTLTRASALHCDCQRDARLAREWGFPVHRPIWVVPGNGGIDRSLFRPGRTDMRGRLRIPEGARVVVNPRGIREYVRTDVFFAGLARAMTQLPDVHVVCPGMAGSPAVSKLVRQVPFKERVHLLPWIDRQDMAGLFRVARVSVSLSTHDGTPNSLLEGMACGSFPVVGNIESVREWVTDGINGLVVRSESPDVVSDAICRALTDDELVRGAYQANQALIQERASHAAIMTTVTQDFRRLAEDHGWRSRDPQ